MCGHAHLSRMFIAYVALKWTPELSEFEMPANINFNNILFICECCMIE